MIVVDNSQESNPKHPMNNPDPAKIAYHYKATIHNRNQWDYKISQVRLLLEQLEAAVKDLEEFNFLVGVEHEH